MKLTRPWLFAIVATVAVLVAVAGWRTLDARDLAPAVSYTLLDGSKGSIQGQRGKVMLVNFWATSCVTCVAEMPHLVETHNKFKPRGYETLAVAMSYDRPDYVKHFVQSRALPFSVALDASGDIASSFGDVRLTPTSVLIDKQGRVVKRYLGAPDFAALDKLIGELLAES